LKNEQSGHQASGLKLVPAIGSTSRWPQHSGPSSGGRRQRHDLNFAAAGESAAVLSGAFAGAALLPAPPVASGVSGIVGVGSESDINSSF
jgi:hypothetical protein